MDDKLGRTTPLEAKKEAAHPGEGRGISVSLEDQHKHGLHKQNDSALNQTLEKQGILGKVELDHGDLSKSRSDAPSHGVTMKDGKASEIKYDDGTTRCFTYGARGLETYKDKDNHTWKRNEKDPNQWDQTDGTSKMRGQMIVSKDGAFKFVNYDKQYVSYYDSHGNEKMEKDGGRRDTSTFSSAEKANLRMQGNDFAAGGQPQEIDPVIKPPDTSHDIKPAQANENRATPEPSTEATAPQQETPEQPQKLSIPPEAPDPVAQPDKKASIAPETLSTPPEQTTQIPSPESSSEAFQHHLEQYRNKVDPELTKALYEYESVYVLTNQYTRNGQMRWPESDRDILKDGLSLKNIDDFQKKHSTDPYWNQVCESLKTNYDKFRNYQGPSDVIREETCRALSLDLAEKAIATAVSKGHVDRASRNALSQLMEREFPRGDTTTNKEMVARHVNKILQENQSKYRLWSPPPVDGDNTSTGALRIVDTTTKQTTGHLHLENGY